MNSFANSVSSFLMTLDLKHGDEVLLCKRSPKETLPNIWSIPGGGIENGETPGVGYRNSTNPADDLSRKTVNYTMENIIKDLDEAEKAELILFVETEFDIENDDVEKIIEEVFAALVMFASGFTKAA